MVVQREVNVKIFGKGEEGEEVTVEFAGQKGTAKVVGGKWLVVLKPVKVGGPYTIKISSKDKTVELKDVLVGDVWVCGGQSNMETQLGYYMTTRDGAYVSYVKDYLDYSNNNIRLAVVRRTIQEDRIDEPSMAGTAGSNWHTCEPNWARNFSATGYYFGKRLQEAVNIPIGLIASTVGGTPVESWVPKETLKAKSLYAGILSNYQLALERYPKAYEDYVKQLSEWSNKKPANVQAPRPPMSATHYQRPNGLFNGMIAPIVDFPVKGFVWYQGENNAGSYESAQIYKELMKDLILNWRKEWNAPNAPFYQVELAAYTPVVANPSEQSWPYLREAQRTAAINAGNAWTANIIDTGIEDDIHPPHKHESGERLADIAKANVYGQKDEWCGPVFSGVQFDGPKAVISFSHAWSGLVVKDFTVGLKHRLASSELRGFAVCGEDEVFKWAKAVIRGQTVEVTHPDGKKIVSVRYAWQNFPLANLFNRANYPAYPFRTDDWNPNRPPLDVRTAANGRTNLALLKPVKTATPNSLTKERGLYGGLTDGQYANDTDRFIFSTESAMNFPKEAVIELGAVSPVDTVVVCNSTLGGTKTVEVALSKDGSSWQEAGKTVFANYSDERWVLKLPKPVDASFVRIRFPDVYDVGFQKKPSGFVFLREVLVFGK